MRAILPLKRHLTASGRRVLLTPCYRLGRCSTSHTAQCSVHSKHYPVPKVSSAGVKKQGSSMRCNEVPLGNRSLHF